MNIHRITKHAFQNLGRNLWLSLMTITVLVVTLLSVNVLLSLNVIANTVSSSLEDRVDVSVYLVPTATEDQVRGVRSYIVSLPQVAVVTSISPDDALAKFRERHHDDAQVLAALDEVGGNALGTTLVVRAKSLDQYPAILTALDHPAYRDLIQEKNYEDYSALIARVEQITSKVQQFGIALLVVFAIIALIITVNAVRVSIFTRKEEIGIMKLVGANGSFIRGPFILESILLSVLALIIAGAAVVAAVYVGTPFLAHFLGADPGLLAFFKDNAFMIVAGELGALAILTTLASIYAVGRYMKV